MNICGYLFLHNLEDFRIYNFFPKIKLIKVVLKHCLKILN